MNTTTTIPTTAESPDPTPSPTVCAPDTVPGEATLPWCFTQNQRNEVRLLVKQAGAVMANPEMKQQTYVVVLNDQGGAVMSVTENKTNTLYVWYEQANTLSHRDYKQPQAVVVKR